MINISTEGEDNMKILKSGFEEFDKILGSGILEGTNVLFIYDSFSLGWIMPFKIFQYRVSKGDFGVIINYNLPLSKLALRAKSAGLDIEVEGKNGNLAIIDVFGSRYGSKRSDDYVYTIEGFDPDTYVPKLLEIYHEILKKANNRRLIEINFTVDGLAFEIGEDRSIRILKHILSKKEYIQGKKTPSLLSMLLLNKDRVSKEFVSWNIEFGDYVIEFIFEGRAGQVMEEMYVLKSPSFDFEPKAYACTIKNSNIFIQNINQRGRVIL